MPLTSDELTLLRSLCEAEVLTFSPEDMTSPALERFEQTVALLRRMEGSGWVQLEITHPVHSSRCRYRPQTRIAAARCTEQGREVLRHLR